MTTQLKRIKPYKAKSPEETVFRIKTILNGIGLQFDEKPIKGNSFFNAVTLNIINPDNKQIVFSTYGKGNSEEWASASAWGEMMERLQNLAFYMILIYPSQPECGEKEDTSFKYYPDEKTFSLVSEYDFSFNRNYEDLTGIKPGASEYNQEVIGIPFYSVFDQKIEYFPFRAMQVIVGSNGMCSGNTREEALIQGISEIFERHVLKSFYLNPFTPPDIPLNCFAGTDIESKINQLIRQFGYDIQIKDCSMGKGYPVIGVIIKNNQNEYAFHLGADPSPITALERCFTEMFQGGNICFQSLHEMKVNLPYDLNTSFWQKNLSLTIRAYAGQWPPSIFGNESDYDFKGFVHPHSISDHDDLQYLLNIMKNENRKLFIRDNSFLGQPAYFIYIPGMSEITSFPDNSFSTTYLEFDRYLSVISSLKKNNINDRADMMKFLPGYIDASPNKQFIASDYFKFYRKHPIAQLSSEQFLSLINFSLLEGKISDHFNEKVIKTNPFINSFFEKKTSFEPSELFQMLNIPECFECDDCSFINNCNLPYIFLIWERIKKIMNTNLIDQNNLMPY